MINKILNERNSTPSRVSSVFDGRHGFKLNDKKNTARGV